MRFKYYLRGAGIGVIVATLVLAIAFLFHDNISDEEVIRRAMKLGMVMQENTPGTLADTPQGNASSVDLETGTDEDPLTEPDQNSDAKNANQAKEPDQSSAADTDDKTTADQQTHADDQTDTDQQTHTDDQTDTDQRTHTDDQTESSSGQDSEEHKSDDSKDKPAKKDSDEVKIVIESGDVSRMVSAKVFEAGLVEDADEFNSYLGAHDYDNQLQPGTYKIKKGSSFRQIAQILTRQ